MKHKLNEARVDDSKIFKKIYYKYRVAEEALSELLDDVDRYKHLLKLVDCSDGKTVYEQFKPFMRVKDEAYSVGARLEHVFSENGIDRDRLAKVAYKAMENVRSIEKGMRL